MREPSAGRAHLREIESQLGLLGGHIARRPWHYIFSVGLLTLVLLAQLPSLRIDTSFIAMLPPGDPALDTFAEFRSHFGSPERAVLAVRPAAGLFEAAGMRRLAALQADLETEVPGIGEIKSILNARDTRGEADRLIVEDFLADWPQDAESWRTIELRARANPLYHEVFVSRSGEWTLIVLKPEPGIDSSTEANDAESLTGFDDEAGPDERRFENPSITTQEMIEITTALKAVVERHRRADFEILLGGGVVMGAVLAEGIERDLSLLLGLAIVIIGALLFVVFRSLSIVFLVLTVVLLSLASSIGLMAGFGVPVDVGTQILPALLLSVGVGYSVHVVTIFMQNLRLTNDKAEAVTHALSHSGLAILMTALTTMGGLFAFRFAGLMPLQRIGTFAPAGVLSCALYSLVLLPALLVVLPIRCPAERGVIPLAQRALDAVAIFSVRHRHAILWALGGLLLVAAGGIAKIQVSHNPLHWLPEESAFRHANEVMDREFGGAYQLELIVRMHEGRSLRDPEVLQAMRDLADELSGSSMPPVRANRVVGLHDVVEEIHQALHGGALEQRRIPQDARLVAQELLLFENSGVDDLEELVDTAFEVGRLGISVNYADAYLMTPFFDFIEASARRRLQEFAETEITGLLAISQRTFSLLLNGMLRSYLVALVIIGALMLLLIGRMQEGLVSIIPNLSPIILTLGIMGYLGIPLGMMTLLVGNIALGLAVDDTIHFVHGYLREREQDYSPVEAVRRTLATTGSALLFTSVALTVGFSVFAFASLDNLVAFGLLASTAIALAFAADMLVAPGLMVMVAEWGRREESDAMLSSSTEYVTRQQDSDSSPS